MRLIFLCFLFISSLYLSANARPLSNRIANYTIALTLDTLHHEVTAQQHVLFRNPSEDTIWTIPFHLYYNAFQNNRSIFYEEAGGLFGRKNKDDLQQGIWARLQVSHIADAQGHDLTDSLHYVHNGNPFDFTVLVVHLKDPILPQDSYALDLEWQSRIPKASIRTGYLRDYYFMAQWYPKIGVYEPAGTRFAQKGQWNCHPYHANTEYYGDFGVYEVSITVPTGFVVAASGSLQEVDSSQVGQVTHHFLAEDVIDFTWAACPRFSVIERAWRGVRLQLFITPEHECNQDRFFNAAEHALDFLADYLEPYPYPTLTMVSPPYYGLFSGAMEYPTLFTAPTLCLLPANIRTTETITMHELTHQYFMQLLATNEQEEAWLDEGFTAFFEAKMMDRYYPKGIFYWDYLGMHIGSMEYRRGRFFNADNIQIGPMSQFGWHFEHGGHREIVYGKAAIGLQTLEGLLGERCFRSVIRQYYKRWKFRHPSRLDFIAVVQEVTARFHPPEYTALIDTYLQEWIYGTSICDYSVHSITNTPIEEPLGYLHNDQEQPTLPADSSTQYRARTILYRLGDLTLPQAVQIVFDDGTSQMEFWDGQARSHDFTYEGTRKIVTVHIDPTFKRTIDNNIWNNSHTLEPDHQGIVRHSVGFMGWFQNAIIALSSLI